MASAGLLPTMHAGSGFAPAPAMVAVAPHLQCFYTQLLPSAVFGAAPSHAAPERRAAATRPARGRGRRGARVPVALPEVLRAIESLYRDQLQPYGRLLRKRLAEHSVEVGGEGREVDDRELRALCASCPWLRVESAEGAEWTVAVPGRAQDFVDVHSPEDVYPPKLWAAASAYFSALEGEEMVLPGGRYMCARMLAARELSFLSGYSLGQVAHIVQLAISHKKLLGYSDGTLVPYARSQSMLKEQHAESQRRCPVPAGGDAPGTAGWEALRESLQQILEEAAAAGEGTVPLSNLKRLFQSRFGVELSETALGHAKLSELLQDPRIRDLCTVKLEASGHVLVPSRKPAARSRISLVEGLGFAEAAARTATQPAPLLEVLAPAPAAPKGRSRPQPLCFEELASTPTTPTCSDGGAPSTSTGDEASSEPAYLSMTPARTLFPPTPSPYAMAGSMIAPRLFSLANELRPGLDDVLRESSGSEEPREVMAAQLSDDPAIIATEEGGAAESRLGWRTSGIRPLTPSTLGSLGLSVQNTFIHAPLPPPTPMKITSRLRASSLPRAAR